MASGGWARRAGPSRPLRRGPGRPPPAPPEARPGTLAATPRPVTGSVQRCAVHENVQGFPGPTRRLRVVGRMGRRTFTRRRALGLGAAAGLGSMLAPLRAMPALAAATRGPRPRGFGLTVTPADFDGGRTSRVLRARRFDLLGVRGRGSVEVRVRARGGAWSPWIPLAAHGGHAADNGTGERASDPIWTGGSDELQLRLARAPRAALRIHFVAVPAAARRRAAAATRAHARAAAANGAA